MDTEVNSRNVSLITEQVDAHLANLAAFWAHRAPDSTFGGFRTSFDAVGNPVAEDRKYLLSHTRLVWSFSALHEHTADPAYLELASMGFDYLLDHFHDREHGGWHWIVDNAGAPIDRSKLIYGQSFAVYALAMYGRVAADTRAIDLASLTWDRIVTEAADTRFGGFLENLDSSWRLAGDGAQAGDRKSLDIHMHLMEALTELFAVTGRQEHARRLREVRDLIVDRMIDHTSGAGGNQYSLDLSPIPPIIIDKTWIAERSPTTRGATLPPTTSYGHNLELGWLIERADEVLGESGAHTAVVTALADHALQFGFDEQFGGVYRDGPPIGPAADTGKEFWQNAEALVGWLNAYSLDPDEK
ncbi:mannobiose 2-epimerase [Salinibacterium sp. CAN_S4]|uniref:AGE family epimerase/isomerase n=1 Tax=Salinibacterium sp. CAN_S4 TaxID=2787727 RepID=UPI0018EF5268